MLAWTSRIIVHEVPVSTLFRSESDSDRAVLAIPAFKPMGPMAGPLKLSLPVKGIVLVPMSQILALARTGSCVSGQHDRRTVAANTCSLR